MQLDEENKPEGCQTRGEGGRETKDRFGARKGQENIDESEWTREKRKWRTQSEQDLEGRAEERLHDLWGEGRAPDKECFEVDLFFRQIKCFVWKEKRKEEAMHAHIYIHMEARTHARTRATRQREPEGQVATRIKASRAEGARSDLLMANLRNFM